MGWHNLLVTKPARLSLKNSQLHCRQDEGELSLPLEDIASITLESPQTSITGGLLSALATSNTLLISCDQQHLPNGLLLPLAQHSRQLSAIQLQINANKPLLKRLWQCIVQQKISHQAAVLQWQSAKHVARLKRLVQEVSSGDRNNTESTAARLYFSSLFNNFRRHNNDFTNCALNYGYAVIRAAIARELTAFGFHPSLGIHHCSELNSFNLADDIIEPFRPMLDSWAINELAITTKETDELEKDERARLTQVLQLQVQIQDEKHSLQSAIRICIKSLVTSLKAKQQSKLLLPKILLPPKLKKLD